MRFPLKKSLVRKSILLLFFVFTSALSFGQAPCPDPLDPFTCDPDIEVPIDDGVYFIIAAGMIIGYTLLKRKKGEVEMEA